MDKKEMGGITFNAPVTVGTFVKVESGATYIKNNLPGVTAFSDQEEERKEVEEARASEVVTASSTQSKIDAIVSSINKLVADEGFKKKQDFGAIRQMICEMSLFDKFTNKNMIDVLDKCIIPASLRPTESSLKVLTFSNSTHPNWKVQGEDFTENKRLIELADKFRRVLYSNL